MANFITHEKKQNQRIDVSKLPSFHEIFLRHLPTKQGHNYNPLYERFFDPVRLEVKRVLEIGVEAGTSLRMWADYFPNAEIYGFDIDPACRAHRNERIEVIIGDQTSNDDLAKIPENIDIVIDDGLHSISSQISTFGYLYQNRMSERGIYVVEDVIGAYPVIEFFNRLANFVNFWPKGESGSIWSSLNNFSQYLVAEGDHGFSDENIWFIKNTLGVSIYRHLIFVDKGCNPEHGQAAFRLERVEEWSKVGETRQNFLETSNFTTTHDRLEKKADSVKEPKQ